ncbi:MAG: SufE family protein [Bacteroidales bacterium]|nr:SufE family protein [Bacteroidales bacterium]
MTINEIQDQIVEDFSVFDEWLDKYQYLIDLATDTPQIDNQFKTNQYLINGCQSRVWLHAELKEGLIYFTGDSDAIITNGIISLLIKVLNKRTPKEIIEINLYFIDKIGLSQNLSPTRANGLAAMLKQMKLYAVAFDAKSK